MTEMRTYLIEIARNGSNGTLPAYKRITVPSTYKVTYGPLLAFEKNYESGPKAVALRVYRSEKDCVALFRDVLSFRQIDGAITVEIMEYDTGGQETWTEDNRGDVERTNTRAAVAAQQMVGAHNMNDFLDQATDVVPQLLDTLGKLAR